MSGLGGISDGEAVLFRHDIHVGANRKVVRGLVAAMQQEDQAPGSWLAGGPVKLVPSGSCSALMRAGEILSPNRNLRENLGGVCASLGRGQQRLRGTQLLENDPKRSAGLGLGDTNLFGRSCLGDLRFQRREGRLDHDTGKTLLRGPANLDPCERAHEPVDPTQSGSKGT